jgi:hypothetical protein
VAGPGWDGSRSAGVHRLGRVVTARRVRTPLSVGPWAR